MTKYGDFKGRIKVASSEPSDPVEGDEYLDSATLRWYRYNGTAWYYTGLTTSSTSSSTSTTTSTSTSTSTTTTTTSTSTTTTTTSTTTTTTSTSTTTTI